MDVKHKRKLQLGRKAAYLRRCIRVVELLERHETPESIRLRVFKNYIHPVVSVSYAQFNNMLNEPNPAKQLAEIEQELQTL
ncbi:MAG: hypothetical protein ACK5JD_10985 [Mangrovibacterium sp.]